MMFYTENRAPAGGGSLAAGAAGRAVVPMPAPCFPKATKAKSRRFPASAITKQTPPALHERSSAGGVSS